MSRASASFLAGLMGLAFVWASFGTMAFEPGAVDWLMISDRGQAFLGWHLFRNEPSSFPLGQIPSLVHPVGASLAYTDSMPWFTLLLGLFSDNLPSTFQPLGIWFGLSYFLLGVTSFLLLRALTRDVAVSLAGSLLFVVNPMLLFRRFHPSLCAHWLIVAAGLGYVLSSARQTTPRLILIWAPLLVIAGGTHPYLAAMVLAIALASTVRRVLEGIRWQRAALEGAAMLAILAASLGVFGYLLGAAPRAPGFGGYSANLFTFIDPDGWSRLLPDVPAGEGQYEGFAFLGLGGLLVVGLATASRVWRTPDADTRIPWRAWLPLVGTVSGLAVFALSSKVQAGGWPILDLEWAYDLLGPIPSTFRASGRFVWPLYYVLLAGSIAAIARLLSRRGGTVSLLLFAAAIQLFDAWPAYSTQKVVLMAMTNPWKELSSPCWDGVGRDYDEFLMVPPKIVDAPCPGDEWPRFAYMPFAYRAGLERMRINSGHLSRTPPERAAEACRSFDAEVRTMQIHERGVYVVTPAMRDLFAHPDVTCGTLDSAFVCVDAARRTNLRDCLADR